MDGVSQCLLLFASSAHCQEFVKANTHLSLSPGTMNDKPALWFRIAGQCPGNRDFGSLQWLSVVGGHGDQVDSGNQPVAIRFDQIVWPPVAAMAFSFERAHQFFPLAENGLAGRAWLNPPFAGAWFALEQRISYDPAAKKYVRLIPPYNRPKPLKRAEVLGRAMEFLGRVKLVVQSKGLLVDQSGQAIARMLAAIRSAVIYQPVTPVDDVEQFVDRRLRAQPNSNLSTEQLFRHYVDYCLATTDSRTSRKDFERRLRPLLDSRGVKGSHSIRLNGRCRHGYRGLSIATPIPGLNGPDGPNVRAM
ncbi:MAG: hypothetical protein ACXWC8_13940 [Limisphaerales bacterium]